ncbi:hypothetical protein FRC12_005859 [Ceratobasidium sp. 428]|nr:hypothetical protein FRC12_005859 [Ceratobasidium sp. 428]
MSSQPTDSKAYRQSSPSVSSGERSHVVDHHAPDVTAPSPAGPRRVAAPANNGNLITVEPLKKTEMQTSYAQDLGLDGVEHGLYGTMINCLGAVVGLFGAIPCCPCPNPFKEVQQGSVGLVTRFGQFYKGKFIRGTSMYSLVLIGLQPWILVLYRSTYVRRNCVV